MKKTQITTTYRNSAELINIVEPFILKNVDQLKKHSKSSLSTKDPVQIVYCKKGQKAKYLVNLLVGKKKGIYLNNPNATIYLIGRNTNDLSNIFDGKKELSVNGETILIKTSKNESDKVIIKGKETLKIEFITAHKAKGLEAEYVVIINAEDTLLGFPNKIEDDPLLNLVLSVGDSYPFAEERRLFYVALTRTKNTTYILVDNESPSQFVLEIEDSCCVVNPDVKKKFNNILCPLCKSGEIIGRVSNKTGKKYYKCTNSPFCKYISYEPLENRSEKLCPICKDYLVLKTGPYGNYYKCANSLCNHTESIVPKKSYSNYDDDLPF